MNLEVEGLEFRIWVEDRGAEESALAGPTSRFSTSICRFEVAGAAEQG